MNNKKIQSFTDLEAWKEPQKLVVKIYSESKNFPKEEVFGLTNQIRRAIVSVTSNIAEGFNRKSYKDKRRFYFMAIGSLSEVQSQLYVARDVGYLDEDKFEELLEQSIKCHKIINIIS